MSVPKGGVALILGNEALGVEEDVINQCDKLVEIPTFGYKNSLNVATACSVLGYSILEKMGIPVKSDGQPAQVQVEIQEEDLEESPELEAIFQEKSAADIDQEEVDAFWDTASHRQADLELTNADALTYEQARRLGLTPENGDDTE